MIPRLTQHLEPLAIAANITQGSATRLDHVLLTIANLYKLFSESTVNPAASACITSSLERRWSKCDQEVFILAVFFNPYIRDQLFGMHHFVSRYGLLAMARRAFRRFNPKLEDPMDGPNGFSTAFLDYIESKGAFSPEMMSLDSRKAGARSAVRFAGILLMVHTNIVHFY